MKTLEQVIKKMELCNEDISICHNCRYFSNDMCAYEPDALHYLKEYQDMLIDPGKMVEYLRQASIQRSKNLARERAKK